ncbi:RNA recognition motif-containing protein [Coniosporium apollinis]|uniref:RNA recognition motif-containing protein n=2 Tax=Coniosporium TaxID=2810619 RepID=A0ABQ9NPQ5_9PEZI|nr:RNA recognition motif-containing protein [Cladosporium sp. JES 115]KAJ9658385.1 RNA recognition motif-containing protein [Coniosporium apollinis]
MAPRRKRQRLSEDGTALEVGEPEISAIEPSVPQASPEKTARKEQQQRRSLFVRSLPATTTTEDLTELFSQSYPIKHAVAVTDPATKQCKGYGFVTFADAEDAQRAQEEFNGSSLQGRKIRVEVAEPRHRDEQDKGSVPSAAAEAKAARGLRKKEAQQQQQPPKLIVRNLPWSVKEPDQLAALFRSYGKVKHATIPKTKPGLLAGFGFVVMRGRKNAEKAIEGVNGKEVDGRTVAVDWAVDKETWQNERKGAGEVEKAENGGSLDADASMVADDTVSDEEASGDEGWPAEEDEVEGEEAVASDGSDESDIGHAQKPQVYSGTLFVRNLPFNCTDEDLEEHFSQFGLIRYARIVLDRATERPKGTGFVCFVQSEDADACVKGAPRQARRAHDAKDPASAISHSILQNEESDPTGKYTMDGRVLQVTAAVDKSEANRLTAEGVTHRGDRDRDKRRLYLLSEGTIASNSPLYQMLTPSEITMREASAKQRKALIESNPSLHLSLTRLSIRNIPRSVTSKDLKALAREAVVGFAKDVKEGKRQRLSKEELQRGGEAMQQAEQQRKAKAKGIVKQAKVVYEGQEGSKVDESTGAGRSRGYGFIEYHTHRSALMGLRWLNGQAIGYRTQEKQGKKASKEDIQDKKKRLIVEFAIENAQVVSRRTEREAKARERSKAVTEHTHQADGRNPTKARSSKGTGSRPEQGSRKRKRAVDGSVTSSQPNLAIASSPPASKDDKLAQRQKIIERKRMMRRTRKKAAA